jgi:hypothetical protein
MFWACKGDGRNQKCTQNIEGEPLGKMALGTPRRRWEVNIKKYLREIGCEDGRGDG